MKVHRICGCMVCVALLMLTGMMEGSRYPKNYRLLTGIAEAKETDGGSSRDGLSDFFHSLTLEPATVAAGDVIQIEATFSVSDDSSRDTVPVKYFYEIQKNGVIFLTSPTKRIDARNGAKTVLGIQVEAAGSRGNYQMVLTLSHPEGTARADMDFAIVSVEEARAYAYRTGRTREVPSSLSFRTRDDERLLGKWRFVSPGPGAAGRELVIEKNNDELVARMTGGAAAAQGVKLKKEKNQLVLRSRYEKESDDCWYIMEDVITLNDRMNNMSVRSEIVDGGTCVSIGRVSKSMLSRVK